MIAVLPAALMAAAHPPVIVPPGAGEDVPVPFHPVRLMLSGEASEGGVAFYEFTVPPESAGAPPHMHTREDEYFYVLSGEVTLLDGEEVVTAGPGALAAMTRGTTHAFWNAGDEELKMLCIVSGENAFEAFFDALVVEMRNEAPEGPEAFGALVGRVAAEHGIAIRPEALPAEAARFYAPPGG